MLFHNYFNYFFEQIHDYSAEEGGGNRYKVPWPDYVAYAFIFIRSFIICQLHKLTISDQPQVPMQLTVFPI